MPLFSSGSRYWPAPVWPSGIFWSGGGRGVPGARGWVGVQSMYFSPISDCGRIRQLASWRKSLKPESSISMTTTALPGTACGPFSRLAISSSFETSTDLTVPTVAPATRTCSPDTTNEPLSK